MAANAARITLALSAGLFVCLNSAAQAPSPKWGTDAPARSGPAQRLQGMTPTQKTSPGSRLVRSCSNPNQASIFKQADGGYIDTGQGWLYDSDLMGGSGWAAIRCWYGLDNGRPKDRPSYTVHYELTGFKVEQCQLTHPTVTCSK
jgi:hypothetical protein